MYTDVVKVVSEFYESYKGRKEIVGYTACNQPIFAFFIGTQGHSTKIVAQYAMHAREWITALLALKHIKQGVQNGSAMLVPLANPDGVALATRGSAFLQTLSKEQRQFLLQVNGNQLDFSLWKANANAVDINVNFDADWGDGESNVRSVAPANYIGTAPNSELETRALIELTKKFAPQATLSYHSKGEEIYWYYKQQGEAYQRAEAFANFMAKKTGYAAKKIYGSSGGYKDWCILKEKLLALTIEVGKDSWTHPITELHLQNLWQVHQTDLQNVIDFLQK